MGNYNFDNIVFYAIKRFVEGCNTIELLDAAKSEREKEEIALVCLLHLDDDTIDDLNLCCDCAGQCKTIYCRNKLKKIIKEKLATIC